jgi:hypothetical protein
MDLVNTEAVGVAEKEQIVFKEKIEKTICISIRKFLCWRETPPFFVKSDERHLLTFAPFASKAIRAALSGGRSGFTNIEMWLTMLHEVAETLQVSSRLICGLG